MTTAAAPVLTRADIWRALGYEPTPAQREILDDPHKTQLVAGGFRGGKSQTAGAKGALAAVEFIALYGETAAGKVAWLVGQDYERCRAEFNYIAEMLTAIYPGVKPSLRIDPGQIRIPVPGANGKTAGFFEIKTKSAADPTSLGMEGPVFIILCEAAHVSHDVYLRLLSRVSEARSKYPEFGFLHMEGTFEGSLGWYASLYTKWQSPAVQAQEDARSFSLPSHSNIHLYPGGEDDPQILALKASLPESVFKERHLGVPVPPSGRVHSAFDPVVHVRSVKYDPALPIYLGIDPGYSGQPSTYAVEVAQLHTLESGFQQWHVIDEIAVNKHAMPGFTAKDVCDIAMSRYWWKNGDKRAVIDVAGTAHAGAQESNEEVWRKTTGLNLLHEKINILPGIDRFDTCLKQDPLSGEPGLLIDPRCSLVISELGGAMNPFDGQQHVYQWMTNQQGDVVGKTPKDAYCDGIKALTYLFINVMGYAYAQHARKTIRVKSRRRR